MSFVSASESLKVKKFESQNEVDEKRRLKQEQWEKTRKPDDPEGIISPVTLIFMLPYAIKL